VPALILVTAVVSMVSSLGAPLVPTIAREAHVALSTAQWVLTAALMTGAAATPVMGRLADGPRQRAVVLAALTAIVAGCALAALTDQFAVLVIARGLQGFGLGLLPVSMAIARTNLPPAAGTRAIAVLSITGAIGAGLGYPVTGLLTDVFNYKAAYWFGAVVAVAAAAAALAVVPSRTDLPRRRFDALGATMLSLIVLGVTVVLSEGTVWGWTDTRSIAILLLAGVLAVGWFRHETTTSDPLVDLRQVRNRSVLTADISGFLIALSMYLFIPVLVEFAQVPTAEGYGFGASTVVSGLLLVPLSVGTFIASSFLVAYERRFGTRSMIPVGSLIFTVCSLLFAFEHRALWEAFAVAGLAGVGIGFTFGAIPGFIVRAVPREETGSAMGFYQVSRSIGLSAGSALVATVLTAYTVQGETFPAAGGFQTILLLAAGVCLATALISYLVPGRASALSMARPDHRIEVMMEQEAELGGAGLMLADE
jgi:MFS family permease